VKGNHWHAAPVIGSFSNLFWRLLSFVLDMETTIVWSYYPSDNLWNLIYLVTEALSDSVEFMCAIQINFPIYLSLCLSEKSFSLLLHACFSYVRFSFFSTMLRAFQHQTGLWNLYSVSHCSICDCVVSGKFCQMARSMWSPLWLKKELTSVVLRLPVSEYCLVEWRMSRELVSLPVCCYLPII